MRRLTPFQEVLMIGTGILLTAIGVATRSLWGSQTMPDPSASKNQVSLRVSVSHPILLEQSPQKVYLKIDLAGLDSFEEKASRTPVNVALVIDRSGSMEGNRIQNAKQAAILAVNHLEKNDIVSVIVYDNDAEVIIPATKVTDKQKIIQQIEKIETTGSTALFAGVSKGAQEIRKFIDKNRVNRIILLSDGQANVGPSSPSELGDLGIALGKEGISVTTLGLGLDYNEDLMTQLALKSDGNHAFVKDPDALLAIFNHEFNDVLSVVAQNVTVTIQCAEGIKPIRVLGREAEIYGNKIVATLRQLYSKQEKYLLVEIEVPASYTNRNQAFVSVAANYDNMHTHQKNELTAQMLTTFSKDKIVVESNINKKVMAAATEQIGVLNNQQAISLRDRGKIEEAKKVLENNAEFLVQGSTRYDAPSLAPAAKEAKDAASKLNDSDWNANRKGLQRDKVRTVNQQSY